MEDDDKKSKRPSKKSGASAARSEKICPDCGTVYKVQHTRCKAKPPSTPEPSSDSCSTDSQTTSRPPLVSNGYSGSQDTPSSTSSSVLTAGASKQARDKSAAEGKEVPPKRRTRSKKEPNTYGSTTDSDPMVDSGVQKKTGDTTTKDRGEAGPKCGKATPTSSSTSAPVPRPDGLSDNAATMLEVQGDGQNTSKTPDPLSHALPKSAGRKQTCETAAKEGPKSHPQSRKSMKKQDTGYRSAPNSDPPSQPMAATLTKGEGPSPGPLQAPSDYADLPSQGACSTAIASPRGRIRKPKSDGSATGGASQGGDTPSISPSSLDSAAHKKSTDKTTKDEGTVGPKRGKTDKKQHSESTPKPKSSPVSVLTSGGLSDDGGASPEALGDGQNNSQTLDALSHVLLGSAGRKQTCETAAKGQKGRAQSGKNKKKHDAGCISTPDSDPPSLLMADDLIEGGGPSLEPLQAPSYNKDIPPEGAQSVDSPRGGSQKPKSDGRATAGASRGDNALAEQSQDCSRTEDLDLLKLQGEALKVMDALGLQFSSNPSREGTTFFDDECKLKKPEKQKVTAECNLFREKIVPWLKSSTEWSWECFKSGSFYDGTKVGSLLVCGLSCLTVFFIVTMCKISRVGNKP